MKKIEKEQKLKELSYFSLDVGPLQSTSYALVGQREYVVRYNKRIFI